MTPLKNDELLTYLKKLGLEDAEIQKETQQVVSKFTVEEVDFPVIFRIFEGSTLLQVITFIPTEVKKEAFSELARLLHTINREIDLPGFGMDEESSTVYFRHVLPCPTQEFDEKLLSVLLQGTQLVCASFGNAVAAVATGAVSYEQILKEAKSAAQKQKADTPEEIRARQQGPKKV